MQRREHPLSGGSLGQQRQVVSLRFGPAGERKVYVQASLHADELPGMLVLHHLREGLARAEADGQLLGEVVLVPAANPIGLSQRLLHRPSGRFELGSAHNFNRHYPDLAQAVFEPLRDRLGPDAAPNVRAVREAVGQWLTRWTPETEADSLRRCLLLLAHDAEVVIDLHCDAQAVMHLYTEEPCWPILEPLARLLGCRAVLLARQSGGNPFDECLSGLWWQLAAMLRSAGLTHPLPQGCASTTVELRGETDVDHATARGDADALLAYLAHTGMLRAACPVLPGLPCAPTPLAGSETLRAPMAGLVVFLAEPGTLLCKGDPVAEIIDPTGSAGSSVHTVRAGVDGVLYARVRERYVHAGGELGKVAGSQAFRTGDLLGA